MKTPYDDIIHLPHPVPRNHPQMPLRDRAAQFAPFAALTGFGAAIQETADKQATADSNGNIIVNGGTIRVTGNSTFDYDGTAQYNGGTIIVNGQQVAYIPNQMMGGMGGNMGVGMNGWGGGYGRNGGRWGW